MKKRRQLILEQLEDRTAPATFGVPWPEADDLTISFAPDGTAAGRQSSNLFRTLDAEFSGSGWQAEILRAFQTWAVEANINIGLVPDGGQPFGTLGLKQGDLRFGDIRVGAYPMAADALAVADPYDPFIANTWVGDVFLNSSTAFGSGGQANAVDLFSVMLHEAGHVLGLDHSTDPGSPMYEQLSQVRTGLTPDDIARLHTLYGARANDAFEGATGNDTSATATSLNLTDASGQIRAVSVNADVTTLQDADVYRLVVPQGATAIDIQVKVSGVSLLLPRLTVYDAAGKVIHSVRATDPLQNDVSLNLDQLAPGDTFYVKVDSGSQDVFGIGGYHLTVQPQCAAGMDCGCASAGCSYGAIPAPAHPSTIADGIQLLATTPGYVEHTYYEASDSITPATPVHTYRMRSADIGPDLTNVMSVVVYAPDGPGVRYQITVLDDQGARMDAVVIVDQQGRAMVQIPSVRSNQDYLVQVSAADGLSTGDSPYVVEIDFAQDGRHLQTFVSDTLESGQREQARTLQVNQSQQFHFVLSASDSSAPVETGLRMTITDVAGHGVFVMTVTDGATRTGDVFLDAGTYTVQFTRINEVDGLQTTVWFELKGLSLSEPLGPQLRDITLKPVEPATQPEDVALSFYWLPYPASVAGIVTASARDVVGTDSAQDNAGTTSQPSLPTVINVLRGKTDAGTVAASQADGSREVQNASTSTVAVTVSKPLPATGQGAAGGEEDTGFEQPAPVRGPGTLAFREIGAKPAPESEFGTLPFEPKRSAASSQSGSTSPTMAGPQSLVAQATTPGPEMGRPASPPDSDTDAPGDAAISAEGLSSRKAVPVFSALGLGTLILGWCAWAASQPQYLAPSLMWLRDGFAGRRRAPAKPGCPSK